MQQAQAARGYRPFEPPSGLDLLEKESTDSKDARLSLISSDRTTLVWSQQLDTGERVVVKMYRHRGPISWWREKFFQFRVQREYEALSRLEECGVPCSKPMFWSWNSCRAFGRYEILVTGEIPETITLRETLKRPININDEEICHLYTLIARMHKGGFHYGTLYAKNILVAENDEEQKEFYFIDVPKALIFPTGITGTRMAYIDVIDISRDIAAFIGKERCLPFIKHYGFDDNRAGKFIEHLKRYRPDKHTRNRHRAECILNKMLSAIPVQD